MGLVLACVIRILQDDWSIRLGENRPEGARKHLAAMLVVILMNIRKAVGTVQHGTRLNHRIRLA